MAKGKEAAVKSPCTANVLQLIGPINVTRPHVCSCECCVPCVLFENVDCCAATKPGDGLRSNGGGDMSERDFSARPVDASLDNIRA